MEVLRFPLAPTAAGFVLGTFVWLAWALGVLLVIGVWAARRHPERRRFLAWFLPAMAAFQIALFGLLCWLNYRSAATRYELTDRTVAVVFRDRTESFELERFDTVARDRDGRWRVTYRRAFSCQVQGRISRGPWGVHGVTRAPGLPWARVHVTDPDRAVALEGRAHLVLSPADPDRFAAEVDARLRARAP